MAAPARQVDRETVARDWKARGFSCGLWTDPPGQVWEAFTHSTDELFRESNPRPLECHGSPGTSLLLTDAHRCTRFRRVTGIATQPVVGMDEHPGEPTTVTVRSRRTLALAQPYLRTLTDGL